MADFEVILPIIFGIFIVLSLTLVVFYTEETRESQVDIERKGKQKQQHQQQQLQKQQQMNNNKFVY